MLFSMCDCPENATYIKKNKSELVLTVYCFL